MKSESLYLEYKRVQEIAKGTFEYLTANIKSGMTEKQIVEMAENEMIKKGATSFWYYDIGAFVFTGERTTLSVSGKNYIPTNTEICLNDVITVDLSPQVGEIWGDYARTLIVQNGKVVAPNKVSNSDLKEGLEFEVKLHKLFLKSATPNMTFEELYVLMNRYIGENNFINLDFLGNLGHSIERKKEDRMYIERGNNFKLSDVKMFTFEPHIQRKGSLYGFKMENIYLFSGDELIEL